MRHPTRWLPLLLVPLVLLAGCRKAGPAAGTGSVSVEDVRAGLPTVNPRNPADPPAFARPGSWAPVYVKLKSGKDGVAGDVYRVAVEAVDLEGGKYRYTVAVPGMDPDTEAWLVAYIQPVQSGNIDVTLQTADGKPAQVVSKSSEAVFTSVEPRDQLFLALGGTLPDLHRVLEPPEKPDQQKQQGNDVVATPEARSKPYFAAVQNVSDMPDRWFGYDAVDLAVLVTHNPGFLNDLLDPKRPARRQALLEWVRRGGKLVISVDPNNIQAVDQLLQLTPLLDCRLGQEEVKTVRVPPRQLGQWVGGNVPWSGRGEEASKGPALAVVTLGPQSDAQVLVRETPQAGGPSYPVVVQGSCGLGRVVLAALDVEDPDFVKWAGQPKFWERLAKELAPTPPALAPNPMRADNASPPELIVDLQHGQESFGEVPVIHFGWVALFILFYIVLVGPLDYFVLKKVFKRLELTWLTFPAVVLAVSAGAYLIAYACKQDDLRVNKIDLVEIDLHSRQAYGRTWFTLFSPRLQTYTVGLQPAAPEDGAAAWFPAPGTEPPPPRSWLGPPPPPGAAAYPVVMSTMSMPERYSSYTTGDTTPAYDYAEDAGGIERVPIPVWATRSFQATWAVPQLGDRAPVDADLWLGGDNKPAGDIVNNLPAELRNVSLFYQGQWFEFGDLASGESRRVGVIYDGRRQGQRLNEWFLDREAGAPAAAPEQPVPPVRRGPQGQRADAYHGATRSQERLMRLLLFRGKYDTLESGNSGLRPLDQSWRLDQRQEAQAAGQGGYRSEVILVARLASVSGKAEEVSRAAVSPTRLWLDRLPGQGDRPKGEGYLNQTTYVRVYIPVKPKKRG